MEQFFKDLGNRVLTTVDNHPRVIAGATLIFMLLVHPALTVLGTVGFAAYAYIAKETKK
jgi:hypothetical protein